MRRTDKPDLGIRAALARSFRSRRSHFSMGFVSATDFFYFSFYTDEEKS